MSGLGASRPPGAGQRGQGHRDQTPAPGVLVHLKDKAVPRTTPTGAGRATDWEVPGGPQAGRDVAWT